MDYLPYVDAYGKISDVFNEIKKAAVPPRFTTDFLGTVLGLKSSSYRAMIPLLKKINFLNQDSVPTNEYKSYRDESISGHVLAEQIKLTYGDLYRASEYAHKLSREDVITKLCTLLGAGKDDKTIPKIASTFIELVKLANFEEPKKVTKPKKIHQEDEVPNSSNEENILDISGRDNSGNYKRTFGIGYTINLNLPATTEIEVYNVIFKSLKDNLLDDNH